MIRQPLAALLLALSLSFVCTAQDAKRPNFSGRWRMVRDLSDFAKFNPPDIVVRIVDEHYPTMNVHTVQTKGKNTSVSDVSYFVSGDIATNSLSGRDAVSKSFWDGNTLVIRTETKDSKNENEVIVDRWNLSPDGQTLTIDSHIETESGGADLKLVCRKDIPKG